MVLQVLANAGWGMHDRHADLYEMLGSGITGMAARHAGSQSPAGFE
jgi:hypothetical protein